MTTFEAYRIYLALKLHFTTDSYDIRKTKGRVKAQQKTLEKNFKLMNELKKLKNKYNEQDFIDYLVANFISGDKYGGIYNPDSAEVYSSWLSIQESLSYKYEQDLHELANHGIENVKDLWDCKDGHPLLMKRYFGKTCNLETLVILNKLYRFVDEIDEQLIFDPVWSSVSKTIHKYSPFVKIDKEKFTTITGKVFST